MKRPISRTASVVALALTLIASGTSAQAAVPQGGAVTVQLVDVGGRPLALAGAVAKTYVSTDTGGEFRYATTDAAGQAILPDLPASTWYFVRIDPPTAGAATYAPNQVDSLTVRAGMTTAVPVTLAVGATVTGRLIQPDGAPLVGELVTLGSETSPVPQLVTTSTDATGRYTFAGLQSDVYEAHTGENGSVGSLRWKTRVYAQRPNAGPSYVELSTRMVHSSYDLGVGVSKARDPRTVVGATVRITNTATGAVFEQRTGGVTGVVQVVQFVVPTGSYTIQVLTVATATTPAETWWWTGQYTPLSKDPSAAVSKAVVFGKYAGSFAQFPAA